MMNDDIVSFLRARLDEDADIARCCDGGGGGGAGGDGCGRWTADGASVDFCQSELAGFHPAVARHVSRHDPERVLREVAAKQRTLHRHALSPAVNDPELPWDDRDDCQYDGGDWPCPDLLDLALPYAGHPDFRSAWLPAE